DCGPLKGLADASGYPQWGCGDAMVLGQNQWGETTPAINGYVHDITILDSMYGLMIDKACADPTCQQSSGGTYLYNNYVAYTACTLPGCGAYFGTDPTQHDRIVSASDPDPRFRFFPLYNISPDSQGIQRWTDVPARDKWVNYYFYDDTNYIPNVAGR